MTTEAMTHDEDSDLREYARVLWRRKWVILMCAIAIPGATYAISVRQPKEYSASAQLQVESGSIDTSLFIAAAASNDVPGQALAAAARLVDTSVVASQAARFLKVSPLALRQHLLHLMTNVDLNSGFLTITAVSRAAQQSAVFANAFAQALVRVRVHQALSEIDAAIAQLRRDLAAIPPTDAVQRSQISGQLQRVRALRAAQGQNAQIVAPATTPAASSSPRPIHDAILALLAALLVGIALAFLIDRMDRKVRDVDEIEKLFGAPLLGFVPSNAFGGSLDDPWLIDAFTMLRTTVGFFSVDRKITSIVVTSGVAEEGKTTVAINLALAFARAGRQVILVDADLRRPQVAERLGIEPEVGLESVLIGDVELIDALDYGFESDAGRLGVLAVITRPANPSELLASERMRSTVTLLSELAEIVIFDTAPILEVADTLPLLGQVSVVLPVVRTGVTRRAAIRRLSEVLPKLRADTVGVVVTGTTEAGLITTGKYRRYGRYRRRYGHPRAKPAGAAATKGTVATRSRRGRRRLTREG